MPGSLPVQSRLSPLVASEGKAGLGKSQAFPTPILERAWRANREVFRIMECSTNVNHGADVPAIPEVPLTEIKGEPRAFDLDIAKRLGFARPRSIRQTIERHRSEIETFGSLATVCGKSRGQDFVEYWLNEEQSLLIATVSDAPKAVAVRAMLIKTFVAWRRGHLPISDFHGTLDDLSPDARRIIGGIVKGIVHNEVVAAASSIAATMLPEMVKAALASHHLMIRRGKTAGQLLRESGFGGVKGLAGWFGNRLAKLGYSIEGDGRCEQGDRTARMFDPDRVALWLREGGRVTVEQKVAERRGQTVIRLVKPANEAARVF